MSCSRTQRSDAVRLKPAAPQSRVKHSTTEPLRSLHFIILFYFYACNKFQNTFETRHEISNNVVCATSKATNKPAHMRSLISAFAHRLNIL